MKVYEGERTLSGIVVTVDGKPLPPRFDLRIFSKSGFEWTYIGAEPRQLALALLADHLGNDARALELSQAFMERVVAHLDNAWRMDGAELEEALASLP